MCAHLFPRLRVALMVSISSILLQSGLVPIEVSAAEVVKIATIDAGGSARVGEYASQAIVVGNPAVAYYDATNGDLLYVRATNPQGTSWGTPVVVESAGNVGAYCSLEVVNGSPAIAYYRILNNASVATADTQLNYVRATDATGAAWGVPVVIDPATGMIVANGTAVVEEGSVSLKVVNGNPAVAYYKGSIPAGDNGGRNFQFVRASTPDGSAWSAPLNVTPNGPSQGYYAEMEIVNGRALVVDIQGSQGGMEFFRASDSNGGVWSNGVVTPDRNTGSFPLFTGGNLSLGVVAGQPALSYYEISQGDLRFTRAGNTDGTAWPAAAGPSGSAQTVVDSSGDVGRFSSLQIVDGLPAISYYDRGNGDLKLVKATSADGSAWGAPRSLDTAGDVGSHSSMRPVEGGLGIAYFDATGGHLKYAFVGIESAPNIEVQADAIPLANGATVSFGSVLPGQSAQRTISITNSGTAPLGSLAVSIDGSGAAQFVLSPFGTASLAPGAGAQFTVTFSPSGTAGSSAVIHIASNDPDAGLFNIVVTGSQTPEAEALAFDGVNDFVTRTAPQGLPVGNADYTAEFWVNYAGGQAHHRWFFWHGGFDAPDQISIYGVDNDNGNRIRIHHLSPNDRLTDVVLPLNVWTHLAFVYHGATRTTDILLNGELKQSVTIGSALNLSSKNIQMGTFDSDPGFAFRGRIDEVRLWTHARTAEQIQGYRNTELSGAEVGLAAYYQFNQGFADASNPAETVVPDLSVNANAATLKNFALNGPGSNWSAPGPFALVPEIDVQVDGASVASGADLTFGAVKPGASISRTITITNTGTTKLTGLALSVAGPGAAGFSFNAPARTFIAPGSSVPVTVTFAPTALLASPATLHITSSDASENPFDLVLSGTVLPPSEALAFDGVNDFATRSNPVGIPVGNADYTAEFWVNYAGGQAGHRWFFWHGGFDAPDQISIYGVDNSNGHRIRIHHLSPNDRLTGVVLPLNVWTHLAFVYHSATLTTDIYLNGAFAETVTISSALNLSAKNVQVGTFNSDPGFAMKGRMDEVRLWTYARSAQQIQAARLHELNGASAGLALYFQCNQGDPDGNNSSETALIDASRNGNHATLRNLALTGSDSNFTRPGAVAFGNLLPEPSLRIESPAGGTLPAVFVMPTVTLGSAPSTQTFVIRNTGAFGELNLGAISFSSETEPGAFTVTQPAATTLAPGEHTSITLTLQPTSVTTRTATLSIPSNDLDHPVTQIAVQGHVIASQYAAWRATFFGTSADIPANGPLADADGDGMPNLLEFALGLNPGSNESAPSTPVAYDPATRTMTYQYVRSKAAVAAGLIFTVEWALALDTPWSATNVTESVTSLSAGLETVTATISAPDTRLFTRLKVTEP